MKMTNKMMKTMNEMPYRTEEPTGTDGIHENAPGDSREPADAATRTIGSVKPRFAAGQSCGRVLAEGMAGVPEREFDSHAKRVLSTSEKNTQ